MCTNGNCSNTHKHVLTGDSLQHVNMHCTHSTASLLTWTVHTHTNTHTQVGAHTDLHSTWASTGERWGYTHSCSRATCSTVSLLRLYSDLELMSVTHNPRQKSDNDSSETSFWQQAVPMYPKLKAVADRSAPDGTTSFSLSAALSPSLWFTRSLFPWSLPSLPCLRPTVTLSQAQLLSHTCVSKSAGSSSPEYEKDSLLHSLISLPH